MLENNQLENKPTEAAGEEGLPFPYFAGPSFEYGEKCRTRQEE
jgi:hypothetical protein